ncbi:hypothetical protein B7P43_G07946, partial [Cryptotermes secundus]
VNLLGVQEVRWGGGGTLHEINNDNGVRVVNFATSKNLTVKSTMFPHRNIHKVTWTSKERNAYKILGGKPEGKRQVGRPRRTWLDSIKIDWIDLVQNSDQWRALVNTVMNLRAP